MCALLLLLLESFLHHWSLSDSKSPQVPLTLPSILNNAVVWMVSTHPFISNSSSPFINPLMTSIVKQGSSRGSCPTFPSPNPYYNPTFWSLTLCQVLSGGKHRQIQPFIKPLVTEPRASIIIGITITFMFHNFFQFPCKVEVFILLFTFF